MNDVAFRRAAAAGDLGTVQRLLDLESVDINCSGRNGVTALHKAAEHSRISIIRLLGRRKAKLNLIGGIVKGTALHHAVYWGQTRSVQQLLRLGIDSELKSGHGHTAFDLAVERNNNAILTVLKNHYNLCKFKIQENTKPETDYPFNKVTGSSLLSVQSKSPAEKEQNDAELNNEKIREILTPREFNDTRSKNAVQNAPETTTQENELHRQEETNEKIISNFEKLNEREIEIVPVVPSGNSSTIVVDAVLENNVDEIISGKVLETEIAEVPKLGSNSEEVPATTEHENMETAVSELTVMLVNASLRNEKIAIGDGTNKTEETDTDLRKVEEEAVRDRKATTVLASMRKSVSKSVQIVRPGNVSSGATGPDPDTGERNSTEEDVLFNTIQQKSFKADEVTVMPDKRDHARLNRCKSEIHTIRGIEQMKNHTVARSFSDACEKLQKIRSGFEQPIRPMRGHKITNLISMFETEKVEDEKKSVNSLCDSNTEGSQTSESLDGDKMQTLSAKDEFVTASSAACDQTTQYDTLSDFRSEELEKIYYEKQMCKEKNHRNIKQEVSMSIKLLRDLESEYQKSQLDKESDSEETILVSPTEEALDDLLSIIPQLHDGKGDLKIMKFRESNRYKWDYVAEIFVDLQDLHSNSEIPDIINDINKLKLGSKIGHLLQRITNIVAHIQVERKMMFSKKKLRSNLIQACV